MLLRSMLAIAAFATGCVRTPELAFDNPCDPDSPTFGAGCRDAISLGDGEVDLGGEGEIPGLCPAEITYLGQIVGDLQEMPEVPDGGTPTFVPYPEGYDAGLAAVIAMVPEMHDEYVNLSATPLQVTEATMIATNYYTDNFDVPPNQSRF